MKLQHLKETTTNPKFLLIHNGDNNAADDFSRAILAKFGYKEVGACTDLDQSDEWDEEFMSNSEFGLSTTQLEYIGIWSKGAGPSEKQVINALAHGDYISFDND